MTLEQYKNLIKEFGLHYHDGSSSESEYGPDAYLCEDFTNCVCGWRRNRRLWVRAWRGDDQRSWNACSLIMYDRGSWNGKYASTVKAGRKLLNEYFRKLKQKEIDKKKREIKESGEAYYA